MVLKICNIPFFCLIFVVSCGLFVVILPVIPLLFSFDCLLLLSTSMYGVSGLLQCRRENTLPSKVIWLNLILQFLFCVDVVSAIYCYFKVRK